MSQYHHVREARDMAQLDPQSEEDAKREITENPPKNLHGTAEVATGDIPEDNMPIVYCSVRACRGQRVLLTDFCFARKFFLFRFSIHLYFRTA